MKFKNWFEKFEDYYEMSKIGFGAHRDKEIQQGLPSDTGYVPTPYLQWTVDNATSGPAMDKMSEIEKELEKRKSKKTYSPQQPIKPVTTQQPQLNIKSNWLYAKVTKNNDRRFKLGEQLAIKKNIKGSWDYIVLSDTNNTGTFETREAQEGLIETLRNIITKEQLKATNDQPSLEDLNQQISQSTSNQTVEEKPKEKKTTIPDNQISQEQSGIDQRFGEIINNQKKEHIMISALAGTGKTTTLKHLAWKYGKPGQKWLYIVFNTKNKVEASEDFPPFVDVKTSNGFLGELLKSPNNVSKIGQTDRILDIDKNIPKEKRQKGKLDKTRQIVSSNQFNQIANKLELPVDKDLRKYGRIGKNLEYLLKSIMYSFKESVIQLTSLGKAFALDPRKEVELKNGLNNILGQYDIDTELLSVKEKIQEYNGSYKDDILYYLEELLGYNVLEKTYEQEILEASIWSLQHLMPNVSDVKINRNGRNYDLSKFRDFDDDLWYTATHANEIVWPKYDFVLADEVQDFNQCQKIMLSKLSEAGAKIVAVGDQNQSLYRFRGADGKAFNNISSTLESLSEGDGQTVYNLTLNYRSKPAILDYVNKNTHVNNLKSGRKWADDDQGIVTEYEQKFDDTFNILSKEVSDNRGKVPQQTAFIARTNEPLVKTALILLSKRIPFIIIGKELAGDLTSHVFTIMNKRKIEDSDSSSTLSAAISEYSDKEREKNQLSPTKKQYVQELQEITDVILSAITSYEQENNGDGNVKGFRDWIKLRLSGYDVDSDEKDLKTYKEMVQKQNPVILTTTHKSKGLEFSRVYILRNDLILKNPKSKRPEDVEQDENGKYVAYTRAQNELHILELENQPGYKEK